MSFYNILLLFQICILLSIHSLFLQTLQSQYLMKEQQTYQPNSHLAFIAHLKNVYELIQQGEYSKCQQILTATQFTDHDHLIEIDSLRGYVLSLGKKYQQALAVFDQCLKKRPYHLASKKRRALMLQKLGAMEECTKEFQSCLYLQPQSKSIRNKIKRLESHSAKSYSVSSEDNKYQQKIPVKQYKKTQQTKEEEKPKVQSVKFGNFQIIQITANEDSDEHFAIIKQQISKLADKKPKKSILKDPMSASIFKQKQKSKHQDIIKQEQHHQQALQKIENIEEKQEKPKIAQQLQFDKPLKKKAKSVTFKGDTNLQDFN